MLHLNPHWANLPLFARKGWKMLPLDEFSDSVNERGEPTNAAEKMEKAMQSLVARQPSPKQLRNDKQTALEVKWQDLQDMQRTPAPNDPAFAEFNKAIKKLTGKPLGHHKQSPGETPSKRGPRTNHHTMSEVLKPSNSLKKQHRNRAGGKIHANN